MRTRRIIAALAGLMAVAAPALAQNYPATQKVLLPEVEVRCGPSKNFIATSKLKKGDPVFVLRANKDPNWLEITPPRPDSFSWINAKYVKQMDATSGYVDCDPTRPVPILPGSRIGTQRPTTEGIKLTAGTIVVLVAPPMLVEGGETWLPIQPQPNEVRYIPADAVTTAKVVVAQPVGTANWNLAAAPGVYSTNSDLAEGDKAYAAKDYARATAFYQRVLTTGTENQKMVARNRLANMPQAGSTPAQPTANAKVTAMSPSNPGPNLMELKKAAWTPYGRLYETGATADAGQPLYRLEITGKDPIYVSTDPTKSLKAYVNRTITVWGPTVYRADSAARLNYVMATSVAIP